MAITARKQRRELRHRVTIVRMCGPHLTREPARYEVERASAASEFLRDASRFFNQAATNFS